MYVSVCTTSGTLDTPTWTHPPILLTLDHYSNLLHIYVSVCTTSDTLDTPTWTHPSILLTLDHYSNLLHMYVSVCTTSGNHLWHIGHTHLVGDTIYNNGRLCPSVVHGCYWYIGHTHMDTPTWLVISYTTMAACAPV